MLVGRIRNVINKKSMYQNQNPTHAETNNMKDFISKIDQRETCYTLRFLKILFYLLKLFISLFFSSVKMREYH